MDIRHQTRQIRDPKCTDWPTSALSLRDRRPKTAEM